MQMVGSGIATRKRDAKVANRDAHHFVLSGCEI